MRRGYPQAAGRAPGLSTGYVLLALGSAVVGSMGSMLPEQRFAGQADTIARRQSTMVGIDPDTMRNRVRSGRWQRLQRGVYATFSGDPARETLLWAALLRAGLGAVLSHQTAAERHGLVDEPSSVITITVPASRSPARYVHRVERPHGLPAARRQARIRQGTGNRYLDNLYQEFGVCVEIDGTAAHPADEQWRDKRRDNANTVSGLVTLRLGLLDLGDHRCETAADVATVLRRHGWLGSPRPCPRPGCSTRIGIP